MSVGFIDILQSLIDGILFGSIYALIGLGFTLIFGAMEKLNMAYAASSIGGAYVGLGLATLFSLPLFLVFLIGPIAAGLISILVLTTLTVGICGSISGTVNFDGKGPKKKKLKMDADPVCGKSHQTPVYRQDFVMDDNNNLANVIVYLKNVDYEKNLDKNIKANFYNPLDEIVIKIRKHEEDKFKDTQASIPVIYTASLSPKILNDNLNIDQLVPFIFIIFNSTSLGLIVFFPTFSKLTVIILFIDDCI